MSENLTPLSAVLSPQEGKGINKKYIEIILEEEIPVFCLNKNSGKERLMPFKTLYGSYSVNFWLQSSEWDYFLTPEYLEKLKQKAIEKTGVWDFYTTEQKKPQPAPEPNKESEPKKEPELGYGNEYSDFVEMPVAKKVDRLKKNKQRLNDLAAVKNKDPDVVAEVLVDTTKDAALINQTVLAQAIQLGDDEAKKLTQDIVDSTHEMVKSSAQLLTDDFFNNDLMKTLVEKSNGTIVQHMTRVYLNGVAFLAYYNNMVTTSSAILKLRISFAQKYGSFYHRLLPHVSMENMNLERVFLGGMRSIAPETYFKWAVGFLIHDIGKASAIQYHEGEAAYNRSTVIEHVKTGYKSIMTKTNYPMEASLITGYHHEYYGSPDGYGYFRAYLDQYKKSNPDAKQDHCITYDLEPILDYQALAYFPAKVLEIIDVYDSVTDPKRIYRKAMSPNEALAMMHTEFIEKHQKLDPILLDVFDSFIREKEGLAPVNL